MRGEARARVCVAVALPCSLNSSDFCSFPLRSPRADARVSSRHPPNLPLLVARRPVLHVCPVSPGVFPVSGLGGQVCVDFEADVQRRCAQLREHPIAVVPRALHDFSPPFAHRFSP